MSVEVMALVWRADLPAMDKIVLLRLADFSDAHGGNVYPSVGRLVRECGVSERHVQGVLRKMTAAGLLTLVRAGGGRNRPAEYRINLGPLKGCIPCGDYEGETLHPMRGIGAQNPAPGAPISTETPQATTQNPAGGAQNPAPGAPDPSVTTINRQREIPPLTPHPDQPTLFGHDTGRADASASGQDTGEPSMGELFEEWWTLVPKKASKGAAMRAFATALKRTDFGTLKAGIMRYGADCADRDPRYVKHPATWLNGQCWLDDPTPTPATGGPTNGNRHHHHGYRSNGFVDAARKEAARLSAGGPDHDG